MGVLQNAEWTMQLMDDEESIRTHIDIRAPRNGMLSLSSISNDARGWSRFRFASIVNGTFVSDAVLATSSSLGTNTSFGRGGRPTHQDAQRPLHVAADASIVTVLFFASDVRPSVVRVRPDAVEEVLHVVRLGRRNSPVGTGNPFGDQNISFVDVVRRRARARTHVCVDDGVRAFHMACVHAVPGRLDGHGMDGGVVRRRERTGGE